MTKIAICGDLHFGVKDSSYNAFRYQKRFFDDIFIPTIKKERCDEIVFLGDILHSRRNINLRILSEMTNLFKDLKSTGIKINGVVGNHDLYFRNSYDLATVKELDLGINYGDSQYYIKDNCLYIHWHNTKEELEETIRKIKESNQDKNIEYIFGHFAFFGFKLNSMTTNTNIDDAEETLISHSFQRIRYVFSGHFHSPSERAKVKYVGVPYQLTWAEAFDRLGFYILDTQTHELTFVENPYRAFEVFKVDKISNSDDVLSLVEECDYRKLYKIYYSGASQEPQARHLYNQILLKNHDAIMVDETIYNEQVDVESDDENTSSIESLIHTYFMSETNNIPYDEREDYYNIFKSVYEQVKVQSETLEI